MGLVYVNGLEIVSLCILSCNADDMVYNSPYLGAKVNIDWRNLQGLSQRRHISSRVKCNQIILSSGFIEE